LDENLDHLIGNGEGHDVSSVTYFFGRAQEGWPARLAPENTAHDRAGE
jgi:hypothetical protein